MNPHIEELPVAALQLFVAQRVARVVRAEREHNAIGAPVGEAARLHEPLEQRKGQLVARGARNVKGFRGPAIRLGTRKCLGSTVAPGAHEQVRLDALAAQKGPLVARKDALLDLRRIHRLRPRHAHARAQIGHVEHAGALKRGANVRSHLVRPAGASCGALRSARRGGRVDDAHHARLPDLVASRGVELTAVRVERRSEVDALVAQHIGKVALQVLKRAELLEALRARNARRVVAVDGQLEAIVVEAVAIERASVVVEACDRVAVDIVQRGSVATPTGDARLLRGATAEDECKLGGAQVVGLGDHF